MKLIDYQMRGGSHPDKEIDAVELQIAKNAYQSFVNSPIFQKKGLKWTYNWFHFKSLYWTQNPELIKFQYDKMQKPHYLEVEVSTVCDLKCTMCEHTHWKEKNQNMSFEDFKKIINQFPQLKWLGMTGIGESYCNPEYPKMLEYIKKKGIYVENFDNFNYMTPENIKQMVDLSMDKLYISLDAATKETYEKIRVGADWDKVIKNIKLLDAEKKAQNSYFPELWFHFIVSKDNKHEIIDYLDTIDKMNIDVKQVQFTLLLHAYEEIKDKVVTLTEEEKNEVINHARDLGLNATFNVNTSDKSCLNPKATCTAWTQPFIFVDGTLNQCCSMNEQNDRDWQKETSIGNLLTHDINEVWKDFKHPNKNCERCFLFK